MSFDNRFQFHKGAIETTIFEGFDVTEFDFQFNKGAIETEMIKLPAKYGFSRSPLCIHLIFTGCLDFHAPTSPL